jgi:7-cyano-7-deazaguanine synthase
MSGEHAVVMTSGGLDSTVLLHWAISQGYRVTPLFLNYGQHCAQTELITLKSLLPSEVIASLEIVDVSSVFRASPSRLIREANLWCDEVESDDLMLPYRNLFLLVTGAAFASVRGASMLLSAFINSNHAYELDATTTFLSGVESLIGRVGTVRIELPFRDLSKAKVVEIGLSLGVRVAETYSCQVNSFEHCGACPNCVERISALRSAAPAE